jgi:lantibiotic modifying enzyme
MCVHLNIVATQVEQENTGFSLFNKYNTQTCLLPLLIFATESVNTYLENMIMTYLRESSTSIFTRVAERLLNVNTLRTFFRSRAVSVNLEI